MKNIVMLLMVTVLMFGCKQHEPQEEIKARYADMGSAESRSMAYAAADRVYNDSVAQVEAKAKKDALRDQQIEKLLKSQKEFDQKIKRMTYAAIYGIASDEGFSANPDLYTAQTRERIAKMLEDAGFVVNSIDIKYQTK